MEHSRIFSYIDTLVAMSNSKKSPEELSLEHEDLEAKIAKNTAQLAEFEGSTDASKYFDAGSELVDRNIEIGLNKNIKRMKSELKNLTTRVDELEEKVHELDIERDNTSTQIYDTESSVEATQNRMKHSQDEAMIARYTQKIAALSENKQILEAKVEQITLKSSELQKEIEGIQVRIEKIRSDILINEEQLKDVRARLKDGNSYIDIEEKQKDDERRAELEQEINEYRKNIDKIENDPVMLAVKAKELLLADDAKGAIVLIRKIVELVSAQPFMDLPNDEKLASILENELTRAEADRDAFAMEISRKQYQMEQSSLDDKRISYLQKRTAYWQNQIANLRESILDIDTDRAFNIDGEIDAIQTQIAAINSDLERINALINREASEYRKASLEAMVSSKLDELKIANELLSSYRSEQVKDFVAAGVMESQQIAQLNHKIMGAQDEIKDLESRRIVAQKTSKDIIAQEADKQLLASKADLVIAIKRRKNFTDSPIQILSYVEDLLKGQISREVETSKPIKVQTNVDNNLPPMENTTFEDINNIFASSALNIEQKEELVQEEKVVAPSLATPILEEQTAPEIVISVPAVEEEYDVLENTIMLNLDDIKKAEQPVPERIKVVSVTKVKPVSEEPKIEEPKVIEPAIVEPEEIAVFAKPEASAVEEPTVPKVENTVEENIFDFPGNFFGGEMSEDNTDIDKYLNFGDASLEGKAA